MNHEIITEIVAKRVHPMWSDAVIAPNASFSDMHLNAVDVWSIACDIEEATGRALDWQLVEKWQSIADIEKTVSIGMAETMINGAP